MLLYHLVVALALAAPTWAKNLGSIDVAGKGKVYVVGKDWMGDGRLSFADNGFTMHGSGRLYFADKPKDDFSDPHFYWQVPLLGNTFCYDIDVSQVGCRCNAAAYFNAMPGYDSGQNLAAATGDWYCDGNKVEGTWCPEYDTFEGNKHTMASALHTCQYHAPHYYSSCDRGGCHTAIHEAQPGSYGPGKKIDTNKSFRICHEQVKGGDGTMSSIKNTYEQEGRRLEFNVCSDGNYVKNMGYSLPGIVFVASLWDMGSATWLDGCCCSGSCDLGNSKVTMKNFAITGGGTTSPPTTSPPTGSQGCFKSGQDYYGGDLQDLSASSANDCQQKCKQMAGCKYFTFVKQASWASNKCFLKGSSVELKSCDVCVTGPADCGGSVEPTPVVPTPVIPTTACPVVTCPPCPTCPTCGCKDEWANDCGSYTWACTSAQYPWFKDQCKKTCGQC